MSSRPSDDKVPYNVGVIPNWWIEEAPHDTLFVDRAGNRKLVEIENPRRKVPDSEEYNAFDDTEGYEEKADSSFSTLFSATIPIARSSATSRDLTRAQSEAVLSKSVIAAQDEWTALRNELEEAKQIIAAKDREIKEMTERKNDKMMALEQSKRENKKQEIEIEKLESQVSALGSAFHKQIKPSTPKLGRGKLIKKTGEAFKLTGRFVFERAKSLAGGSFSHKSTWDEGVELVDCLLEPESDTYKAMTPDQRKGLKAVKWLLMRGGLNPEDHSQHIPMDLINSKGGGKQQETTTTKYLLREFGGVRERSRKGGKAKEGTKRKRLIVRMKHKLRKKREANKLKAKGSKSDIFLDDHTDGTSELDDDLAFTPPEFKALSREKQIEVYKMLSWNNINRWDFDIFELNEATEGHPLLFMGWAVLASPFSQFAMAAATGAEGAMDNLAGYNFIDCFNISEKKLIDFLRVIEGDYCAENPYHNEIHAADVVQTLHTLIQMKEGKADIPDIQLFSILFAAVVHDVNHPGENNAFQVKTRTDLALTYNDESVLENWHVSHAFTRMLGITKHQKATRRMSYINITNEESDLNILSNVTVDQFVSIRAMVIEAVLHTDMTKHFAMVNSAKALHLEDESDEKTWKTLMFTLHLADISNPAKPGPLFELWTDRCLDEFFAQGDREARLGLPISPNCDRKSTNRAGSQIGFINFVILPAYEVLASLSPYTGSQIVPIIQDNVEYWQRVSEEEKNQAAERVMEKQ